MERWLVLPDEQMLFQDDRSISAMEKYMKDHTWDGVISLGDFLDFDSISRWVEHKPRKATAKVAEAFAAGHATLKRRIDILRKKNPKCRYVLIQGNHCARIEDWLDKFPQFEGLIEMEKNLKLDELKVEWVPFWRDPRKIFRKGKATFIHGNYTNQYHSSKMVRQYGTNVFYGHTHDVQEFGLLLGNNTYPIIGKSLGCLCDPKKMDYIRGKPQNWSQAFSTFFFWENGNFNEYTTKIINHSFYSPDGKWYSG